MSTGDAIEATAGQFISGALGQVTLGSDSTSFALWHTDVTGARTGAWQYPLPLGAAEARQALLLLDRRVLAGLDQTRCMSLLDLLVEAALGTPLPVGYGSRWLDLRSISSYATDERARLADLLPPRAVPLRYTYPASDDLLPADLPAALGASAQVLPLADTNAGGREALGLSLLIGWGAQLWQDTEETRMRRKQLAASEGPRRALPPAWVDLLQAAYKEPVSGGR